MIETKQVVVTGQNEVELQTIEFDDQNLGADELLIETEYTFISAGTELANYTGKDSAVFEAGSWCAYPWRSGYANVGIVQSVGEAVERVKPGDRVFTYGSHGSIIRYNQTRLVIEVPEGLDFAIAAASRMAAVSMTAIIVAEIEGSPWVAIYGLGSVGNLAAQAFLARGCRVIGVDPVEARRSLAQRCGISITVGGDPESANAQVQEITGGVGADITIDAVGHSLVCAQALKATANFGQMIILGTPRVPIEGDLTEVFAASHRRWVTIRGALEWCIPMYPAHGVPTSQYSKQEMLFEWLKSGTLQIEPLVSHRLPPSEIKQAYEGLLHQPEEYTGVVLDWTKGSV
ncbi:zinc-binding alcohol dehydrogenase [Chloroflexi bacterium TSY]|nr:zinc-binding alcohol dehydrogenase [Chloroflexi bacterium TSY]